MLSETGFTYYIVCCIIFSCFYIRGEGEVLWCSCLWQLNVYALFGYRTCIRILFALAASYKQNKDVVLVICIQLSISFMPECQLFIKIP